jgi:hypothetical protein
MNYAQLRTIVLLGNYFMKVNLVSLYKGNLDAAMEGIQAGKVFFGKNDFEGLLEAVRGQEKEDIMLPTAVPVEEKTEEKTEEKGPMHLVIDNMPKVIHIPVQTGQNIISADVSEGKDILFDTAAKQGEEIREKALTPEAAEKEVLRRMEERRKKREAERRARILNS